jgi:hypothetical protein
VVRSPPAEREAMKILAIAVDDAVQASIVAAGFGK